MAFYGDIKTGNNNATFSISLVCFLDCQLSAIIPVVATVSEAHFTKDLGQVRLIFARNHFSVSTILFSTGCRKLPR